MIHSEGKYRVRRGDSLWKIARHTYGRGTAWREIQEANQLKPGNPILIGQLLVLPLELHRYGHHSTHGSGLHMTTAATAHPLALAHPSHASVPPAHPLAHPLLGPDAIASQPARPVLFPAFKYKLEHTVMETVTPVYRISCQFTGEFTVQQDGVITGGLTFTPKGIEVQYKQQADGVLRDFFQNCTASVEGSEAKVSLAAGAVLRMGDVVMATTSVEPDPPTGLKYTYQGRQMKVLYRGFSITGVLGYVLKVEYNPPAQSPAPAYAVNWHKVAGGALILGAVVLIVADLTKDGVTLGAGAAESPISFAAAARMFTSGLIMFRAVAH